MIDFNKSRILLEPNEIPKEWVNILPDLPVPMTPLINPMDGKPAPPELAFSIFMYLSLTERSVINYVPTHTRTV